MRQGRWRRAAVAGACLLLLALAVRLAPDRAGEGVPAADVADLPLPYPALLAAFRTPVHGGEAGRRENIAQAAAFLDGAETGPGGVWSFNDVVGPRTEQRGFVPAPEIYSGEYVTGIGGGVCQVSSTLYNAVLLAGLQVVERMHHTRPLTYVPLGRDATVAYGLLDFRFQNTLPFAVQIRTRLTERELEVQLWGEEPLPYEVWVETSAAEVTMPGLRIEADPDLPAGAEWLADEGLPGWQVEVQRVFRQDGQTARETLTVDVYPARPQVVRRGG